MCLSPALPVALMCSTAYTTLSLFLLSEWGRAVGMLHAASLVAGAREGGRVRESSSGCQFRTAMLVTLLPVTHLVLTPQLMLTLRSQSC